MVELLVSDCYNHLRLHLYMCMMDMVAVLLLDLVLDQDLEISLVDLSGMNHLQIPVHLDKIAVLDHRLHTDRLSLVRLVHRMELVLVGLVLGQDIFHLLIHSHMGLVELVAVKEDNIDQLLDLSPDLMGMMSVELHMQIVKYLLVLPVVLLDKMLLVDLGLILVDK